MKGALGGAGLQRMMLCSLLQLARIHQKRGHSSEDKEPVVLFDYFLCIPSFYFCCIGLVNFGFIPRFRLVAAAFFARRERFGFFPNLNGNKWHLVIEQFLTSDLDCEQSRQRSRMRFAADIWLSGLFLNLNTRRGHPVLGHNFISLICPPQHSLQCFRIAWRGEAGL